MSTAVQPVAIIRHIGGFVFDAVVQESHEIKAEITDEPIETGSSTSDHAYLKPVKLSIQVGVGDISLHPENDDPWAGTFRAQVAYDLLTALQASFQPFQVQTGLKLYDNMLIEALRPTQDKDTSGSFVGEIDLKQVNITSTQTVTYPPRAAGTTTHQGSPKNNKGQQQGDEVDDAKKKQSIAASVLKFLRGQ